MAPKKRTDRGRTVIELFLSVRIPLSLFALLLLSSVSLHADAPQVASKQVPAWAASAIWYQIFPDRFRNGDPKNDPTRASLETPIMAGPDWKLSPWTADW